MEVSRAHGIRPTALILGKDSGKPWDETDVLFAKAYERFKKEICPQCQLPTYICHNDDNRIEIKVRKDECAASKVVAEREAKFSDEHKNNPVHGVRFVAEAKLDEKAIEEGLEFVDFRRPYYKELAKKRAPIEAENISE